MIFGGNFCDGVLVFDIFLFIIVVFFLGFVLFIILGNFLVCLVVWKDFYKCLRMLFIFFVINLVILDLIVGMVVELLLIYMYFCEGFFLKLNNVWFIYMFYFIFCIVFVLNFVVLIVDCFIVISYLL